MKNKEKLEKILILIIGILLGITLISSVYFGFAKKMMKNRNMIQLNKMKIESTKMKPNDINKKEKEKIKFNDKER